MVQSMSLNATNQENILTKEPSPGMSRGESFGLAGAGLSLRVAVALGVSGMAWGAGQDNRYRDVFVAGSSDWVQDLNEDFDAAVFIDSHSRVRLNDSFYLLVSSDNIVRGTVQKIKSADSLGDLNVNNLSAAMLKLDHPIHWSKARAYHMILAVRGRRPTTKQIGKAREIGGSEKGPLIKLANAYLPPEQKTLVHDVFEFILPWQNDKYVFIHSGYSSESKQYIHVSLLFRHGKNQFDLLLKTEHSLGEPELGIVAVHGVTGLSKGGGYEILGETWGENCEPCFELFRFDEKTLAIRPAKHLFAWLHD